MWKIGQKVWCILRGQGEVWEVTNEHVIVKFPKQGTIYFNKDGRISPNLNRTLFFSEPKIEAATEPPFVPIFQHGQKIHLVKKGDRKHEYTITVLEETRDVIQSMGSYHYNKAEFDVYLIQSMPIKFN